MAERVFSLTRYRTLPQEIHVVLFGTLLTRSAFFMIWPFLAIFLYQDYGLGATVIGTLLAVAMVSGALSSIYTDWLSDRFGCRRLVLAGALLSALSFLLFIKADSVFWFGLAVAGVSVGCSLLESTCKVLIGDYVEDLPGVVCQLSPGECRRIHRAFGWNVTVVQRAYVGVRRVCTGLHSVWPAPMASVARHGGSVMATCQQLDAEFPGGLWRSLEASAFHPAYAL